MTQLITRQVKLMENNSTMRTNKMRVNSNVNMHTNMEKIDIHHNRQ